MYLLGEHSVVTFSGTIVDTLTRAGVKELHISRDVATISLDLETLKIIQIKLAHGIFMSWTSFFDSFIGISNRFDMSENKTKSVLTPIPLVFQAGHGSTTHQAFQQQC